MRVGGREPVNLVPLGVNGQARKWHAQPEIDFGCADISYGWESQARAQLVVVMHFSRVVDGFARDLRILFPSVLAVSWEDESFGLIGEEWRPLPTCGAERFRTWTFPTLKIGESAWAARYGARKYANGDAAARIIHYYLVSLNDLLHILSESEPTSEWIEANYA